MIKTFDEYINTQNDLIDYKKSVFKLIDDYILNDKEYGKRQNFLHKRYINCYDFFMTPTDDFVVCYIDKDDDTRKVYFKMDDEDYKNLLKFIDNPELYKNINKFNL